MAERLKSSLLDGFVDLVVGPDAYKTLPQLLQVVGENERQVHMNAGLSVFVKAKILGDQHSLVG